MAETYNLIASSTVGAGGAGSIDFTSIPQTYTDLVVKISGRITTSSALVEYLKIRFNSATTNYADKTFFGNGAGAGSVSNNIGGNNGIYWMIMPSTTATTNSFGNSEFYVPDYTSSNYKTVSIDSAMETNGATAYLFFTTAIWQSTSAITSINLIPQSGTIDQYTTAYLYGIKNS